MRYLRGAREEVKTWGGGFYLPSYIYFKYTPNLGFEITISVPEREQDRFGGSTDGARGSSKGALREHGGASRETRGSKRAQQGSKDSEFSC